ncbi:MAG: hypothetical protein JRG73_18205 [Deltaproteobacteria bacterium]|nr:hypothetical protein [Deltaproteobacteria bacterium]MBW2308860.1 hypothetical protein [Deltaproteobacteria bacterium]
MILKKSLSTFLIALWYITGCQTTGDIQRQPSMPAAAEKSTSPSGEIPLRQEAKGAKGFIQLLEERAKNIHSFRAPIVLSVSGRGIPVYEKLSGILLASVPGRYRITAYSARKDAVFDFLTVPGGTGLRWAPPEGGDLRIAAEARQRPHPGLMENLSVVMGAGPFPKPGFTVLNRIDRFLVLYLLEQVQADGALARKRKIWLRGREVLVTRIDEMGFNKELWRVDMEDYRLVDSHWIPHRLSFSIPDSLSMQINLKGIFLNVPLSEELFEPNAVPTWTNAGL